MLKTDENEVGPNGNGFDYLKQTLSSAINTETRAKIDSLVQEVASLKDIEKLLFCLLLPIDGGSTHPSIGSSALEFTAEDSELPMHGFELSTLGVGLFAPGGPSALHLSNQVEQSQAYTWIMSHLEEDPSTCLRKDEVYEDYKAYCDKHHMKTLNTADFGKVMKRAFPNVKPRRLGQRGQSRYCYGGMRKKTEVQPPFLPDLTNETAGVASQGRFSPSSSSGASGDGSAQRRLLSTSPLVRLLRANGSEGGDTVSWVDEAPVRSALGTRGVVVADMAHVLLEYAQQVFGMSFQSLFHLAQHLVTNRYVNSRSRYALSLIAHASIAPPTSLSPPPSAALAEVLQKGLSKSAFDRVGNGRQKTNLSDRTSYLKPEDDTPRTPNRYVGNTSPMLSAVGGAPNTNLSDRSPAALTTGVPQGFPPCSATTSDAGSTHHRACTTPQQSSNNSYRPYQPNFSANLTSVSTAVGVGSHNASALVSPVAQQSVRGVPTYSFQNLQGSGSLRPSAAVALAAAAAVAAHQQQQQQYPTARMLSALSPSVGANTSLHSPAPPVLQLNATTPPTAHKEKASSFPAPSTPVSNQPDSFFSTAPPYLSPVGAISSSYAAHQQSSPYPSIQQPPAPLPPGVGARSPYTPIGNPGTGCSDLNHTSYKRNAPPHPVEAPGAYEPSPRFHLGGQSPNKRARYISTASGSSATNSFSTECQPLSSGSGTDTMEPYVDPTQPGSYLASAAVAAGSPASSGGSSTRSGGSHLASGYSTSGRSDPAGLGNAPYCVAEQPGSAPSPYYSSRYEGLEMRSPAPHGHMLPHTTVDRTRLPSLIPAPGAWTPSSLNVNGDTTISFVQNKAEYKGNRIHSTDRPPSLSNQTSVFRPPVTPFVLESEEEDEVANLPRLGASPGPQIPPSSPTEFLPFYSEAATKSAQAKQRQHQQTAGSASHSTPTSDSTGLGNSSKHSTSNSSSPRLGKTDGSSLETPPPSALMLHSDGLRPEGLPHSPGSIPDSDDSGDRTLTILEPYGEVNNPTMPGGLANAPSPSDATNSNQHILRREELHEELSTPAPAESLPLKPESASDAPRATTADVGITAF
ncbi:unnamed protein product [Calicophoron daubneyi]|uniref:RFX-type winged-helix domain-containing protein n=1 Tax=Calicophoron daubneyi TaxID=300641 RepID=A0AAV2TVZ7_CALDB